MKYILNYIINYIYNYIVLLGLTFCSGSLLAQTPLQVYQDTAALNNPGIKSLYKQYEALLQRIPQNGTLPDLQFSAGYFVTPIETRIGPQQAVLSLSQSFAWVGERNARQQATTQRAKNGLEVFNGKRSKLNFDVAAIYYSLYVLRSAIQITEENFELLSTFRDLSRVRFESGTGSMVDVLRVEMELGELKNQLLYLQDSRQPLMAEFEQLMNNTMDSQVVFPEVLWGEELSLNKDIILDSVSSMNPSVLSLEHQILSYDQEVIAARKKGGPTFTVGLNYTFVGQLDGYVGEGNGRDAILPTVGVKLPLYRKNYNALIREKEIIRESTALAKVDAVNVLQTQLSKGFRDYDDAVRRVSLYLELERYARQAMDILIAEYTSSRVDFEEIIRIDRKLLNYQLELEKARADQNTTVAYINYLMGK